MTKRELRVHWSQPRWWSKYQRGVITKQDGLHDVDAIWRRNDGQLRLYCGDDIHGRRVVVNDEHFTMRAAGRFGRLYISE